jgi:electron transfer flavoprotein beta subunit
LKEWRQMRLLVCLKQVPEPESLFDLEQGRVIWRRPFRTRMGSLDEFALETGLRIKDAFPNTTIQAVTLGPISSSGILHRALGMGADQAFHIVTEDEQDLRPLAVASALADWAREGAFDLILCGAMSEDAMQGAVGPMLARLLDIPWATAVSSLETSQDASSIEVTREVEGGNRQILELPLPCLVTIQSSPFQPRYPALSKLLEAKKADIPAYVLDARSLPAEPEHIVRLEVPNRSRAGVFLEGSTIEKAVQLMAILRQRALL